MYYRKSFKGGRKFGKVGKFRRAARRMKSGRTFKKTSRRIHSMNKVPRGGFRI